MRKNTLTMALVAGQHETSVIAKSLERHAIAALLLIVILGFGLRVRGLDRVGLVESASRCAQLVASFVPFGLGVDEGTPLPPFNPLGAHSARAFPRLSLENFGRFLGILWGWDWRQIL